MNFNYKIHNPQGIYFLTITVVEWVDVFTRPKHVYIVLEALEYAVQKKGLIINAYVIMSNHIHLICYSRDRDLDKVQENSKAIRRIKFWNRLKKQVKAGEHGCFGSSNKLGRIST